MVRYVGDPIAGEGPHFFGKKVDVDLPLGEESILGKFGRIWLHRVQMHKEQTDKQTFFFIYIDNILVVPLIVPETSELQIEIANIWKKNIIVVCCKNEQENFQGL